MIKRLLAAAAAALFISGMVVTTTTTAADAASCDSQLNQLRADVNGVPITDGKADKERAGLLKVVDDATALLSRGKTVDALVKLSNLQTKVDDLASAGRISAESASTLTVDISAAKVCLTTA